MIRYHQKPLTYVKEVCIHVMDLDRSLTFYKDVIGFEVLERTDGHVVLTADGKTPLLTLEQPKNVSKKEQGTTGLFHFALLLPNRTDLSMFYRHLVQTGQRFGASDHQVSEALYIDDPDGNGIEVYRDRPSTTWTWSSNEVRMTTDPLDADSLIQESDRTWTGLPAGTIMGHIHLHVDYLQEAELFYSKGLLFNVVSHFHGAIFMSTGDYHHHLGLNVWNGEGVASPSENSVGLKWFSLVFANEKVRLEVVERLKQIGADVTKEEGYYVTEDSARNKIRLVI